MRPIKLGPYSPITALTTAFNAQTFNSTGAATAPTTTATTDGLAHQVTLTAPVQATLAGITFTIIGTDNDGKAQTETGLVGPASGATVTSTTYFKTVTTIQPSATMGALVVSVGIAAPSLTPTTVIEYRSIVAAMHHLTATGTINFTVQETFDNVFNAQPSTLIWGSYTTGLAAQAASVTAQGQLGTFACRVLVNSVTNTATLSWNINQPSQLTG